VTPELAIRPDSCGADRPPDLADSRRISLPGGRVVTFLDIGTNSVRLLVVRIAPNGSYRVLTRQKEVVRLGEGAFEEERLLPDAIERCVKVCQNLMALARSFNPEEVVAVATAATRESENWPELLNRLRHEAAIDVRIISGREEARLIYLGVASGIDLSGRNGLFIDIGGGSTEIALGDQTNYHYLESFRLGAIRLANIFLQDREKPVSRTKYNRIRSYVRDALIRSIQEISGKPIDLVVGSSGTVMNLAEIAWRIGNGEKKASSGRMESGELSRVDLAKVIELLCSLPLEKRKSVPGINPERADIIIPGGAILATFLEELGIDRLSITTRGLQDGLLEDYLSRLAEFPLLTNLSLRERSVLQLGRSFGINELHARTVTRIALELFDSARELGLHDLDRTDRELLEYAAFLHDIGSFISYTNHHAHSFYIIRNVELLGFNRMEQEIMAQITRFHRKKIPHRKYAEIAELDRQSQKQIRILSTFLRLAESLDRSHAALTHRARFTGIGKDGIHLEIIARGDCQLEVWAVEFEKRALEKTFSRPLLITVVSEDVRPGDQPRREGEFTWGG
jgi:exopolyphosphatase/guanosine-5'-triphosphate,3'-diphosphate pyrophosphatase